MKRPGTRQSYDRLLDRIRDRVPGVALRTTFIVGFPGETEADVRRARAPSSTTTRFDHVGVFTYSHEEGTSRPRARRRRAGAVEDGAARPAHEPAEADRRRAPEGAGSASGSGCWSTVRRPTTSWCCRAGSKARRPTSTPSVYLTECDPVELHGRATSSEARDRRRPRLRPASPGRCQSAASDRVLYFVWYLELRVSRPSGRVPTFFVLGASDIATSRRASTQAAGRSPSGWPRATGSRSSTSSSAARRAAWCCGCHRSTGPGRRRTPEDSVSIEDCAAGQPRPERHPRRRGRRCRLGATPWKCRRRGSIGRCAARRLPAVRRPAARRS